MISQLLIALAFMISLAAAETPLVEYAFTYTTEEYFTQQINFFALAFIIPFIAALGYMEALFGDSNWFNSVMFNAISNTF